MEHPDKVDSVVTVAGAMRLKNPLAPGKPLSFLQPVVRALVKYWPMPPDYADPALAAANTNYDRLETGALMSFLEYGKVIERRLPELKAPMLVIQARNDPHRQPGLRPAHRGSRARPRSSASCGSTRATTR